MKMKIKVYDPNKNYSKKYIKKFKELFNIDMIVVNYPKSEESFENINNMNKDAYVESPINWVHINVLFGSVLLRCGKHISICKNKIIDMDKLYRHVS